MKSKKRETGGSDSIRERIILLGNELWSGNRLEMANDLGQSQSSITRVMTRQQAPSGRLIEQLAMHPEVNLEWLLRGVGEPSSNPESIAMPVFTRLLAGTPTETQKGESGNWLSLASKHYRPTRYWLRVQGDEPICSSLGEQIGSSDLLLMETNPKAFRGLWEQICGVEIDKKSYQLASVSHYDADPEEGPERIEADTFNLDLKPEELVRQYTIRHSPGKKPTIVAQELVLSQQGRPRQKAFGDLNPKPHQIKMKQVLCVCILVLRKF